VADDAARIVRRELAAAAAELQNLDDDNVKLIAYSIVSLQPDRERIMPGGQDSVILTEPLTYDGFVAWRVAEYLQSQKYREETGQIRRPDGTWASPEEIERAIEDHKYLRVYFVVSRRWPKEPRKYDEREIAEWQKLARAIAAEAGRGDCAEDAEDDHA
jgi:hypothetical protein